MNWMVKKRFPLFFFLLTTFLAFFWCACSNSEEVTLVLNYEDTEWFGIEDDDDQDSSSVKKFSSSSKKSTASSSSAESSNSSKSSNSNKESSSSAIASSSSIKAKSSSSKQKTIVFPEHTGEGKIIDYSTDVWLSSYDGFNRKISTEINVGTGTVEYYEDGSFLLECFGYNVPCHSYWEIYIPYGKTIDSIAHPAKGDSLIVEADLTIGGTPMDSGSFVIGIELDSAKIEIIYPLSDSAWKGLNSGNPDEKPDTSFVVGKDTFSLYEAENKIPQVTKLVVKTPIDSGKTEINVSEILEKLVDEILEKDGRGSTIINVKDSVKKINVGVVVMGGDGGNNDNDDGYDDDNGGGNGGGNGSGNGGGNGSGNGGGNGDEKGKTSVKVDVKNIEVKGASKNPNGSGNGDDDDYGYDDVYSPDEAVTHIGKGIKVTSDDNGDKCSNSVYRFAFILFGSSKATCYPEDGSFTIECSGDSKEECSGSSVKKLESGDHGVIDVLAETDDEIEDLPLSFVGEASVIGDVSDVLEFSIFLYKPGDDVTTVFKELFGEPTKFTIEKTVSMAYYGYDDAYFQPKKATRIHRVIAIISGIAWKIDADKYISAWSDKFGFPKMKLDNLGAKIEGSAGGAFNGVANLEYTVR